MRRALAAAVFGAVLVACAEAATPPSSPPADADAPDTLEVRCDGETTEVLTPTVQARTDGVHVLVTNTSDVELFVQWDSGGDGADPGESTFLVPIAPGRSRFRCLPSTDDLDPGQPGGWSPFEVLSFDGWISPELECPGAMYGGVSDYAEGARGVKDPLADAERRFELDGEVFQAGYATSESRTFVNVVDDSPKESSVYISDGAGGWLHSESAGCSD